MGTKKASYFPCASIVFIYVNVVSLLCTCRVRNSLSIYSYVSNTINIEQDVYVCVSVYVLCVVVVYIICQMNLFSFLASVGQVLGIG